VDPLFLEIQGILRSDERNGTPLDLYYKRGGNLLRACQISLSSRCGNYTVEKGIGKFEFFDMQASKNRMLAPVSDHTPH
jgi:hypothetical protein